MKSLIIGVCGIKRSGSTVQFNLIRLALEMAGYKVNVCGHGYKPRQVPEGEVDLVKRHPFSKRIAEAADHIFLTDRDDEEILASLSRFNGKPADPERIPRMRRELERWEQAGGIPFNYKAWEVYPESWAGGVIAILELDIMPKKLLEAFNQIEPPESGQDPKTLLFSNHITSDNR